MELGRHAKPPTGPGRMIDHPEITERPVAKLNEALPIPARLTPELQVSLRGQTGGTRSRLSAPSHGSDYRAMRAGSSATDLGPDVGKAAFTSITHLRFDPRLPLAREIAAYQ